MGDDGLRALLPGLRKWIAMFYNAEAFGRTHLRLGNTGADLSFDIRNSGDKPSGPSAATAP
jgi:hypothetical protein